MVKRGVIQRGRRSACAMEGGDPLGLRALDLTFPRKRDDRVAAGT